MLSVVDEEGVMLVVLNDVVNAGEGQSPHHVLAVGRRVNVEVLATKGRRKGGSGMVNQ